MQSYTKAMVQQYTEASSCLYSFFMGIGCAAWLGFPADPRKWLFLCDVADGAQSPKRSGG